MNTKQPDIWNGDQLEREAEAQVLERFIVDESKILNDYNRNQSLVLAIDAKYGEGKTWFLTRFKAHLELNHPVAFVDAWSDDTNNEPFLAIMAALEEALKPYTSVPGVKEKIATFSASAVPLLGNIVTKAAGTAVKRYIGDELGDIDVESNADDSKSIETMIVDSGVDAVSSRVSEVIDSKAKKLLKEYRAAKKSRETFKSNLRILAASIKGADDHRVPPIVVVVDELDRCRPSYAISLLEEIKHLFDVPGITFLIALHGEQLTHSINAIYGDGFDSRSYLRRFFTRTYKLRRLSIAELVSSHFEQITFDQGTFSYPEIQFNAGIGNVSVDKLAGDLLSEWNVTPREAISVVDGLRLFVNNWHLAVPIELPLVLILLVRLIRNQELIIKLDNTGPSTFKFAFQNFGGHSQARWQYHKSTDLAPIYLKTVNQNLPYFAKSGVRSGIEGYATRILENEYNTLHNNAHIAGSPPPMTSWAIYKDHVNTLGQFVETKSSETEAADPV